MNNSIVQIGTFRFDIRTHGLEHHEPIILLHGFPETNYMWDELMIFLASKGYYCIAPNMRGYSEGARPKGVKNYHIAELTKDILEIAQALGIPKFHLIGHDWGAGVGWHFAGKYPEAIISWTALSLPHPKVFAEAIMKDPVQRKMSKYVLLMQLPFLPEWYSRRNNYKMLKEVWKGASKGEYEANLSILKQKGALIAIINYYRANYWTFFGRGIEQLNLKIKVPTLFIWGEKDNTISAYGPEKCKDYVLGDYKFLKVKGGHWLLQTNLVEVSCAINEHLNKNQKLI